MLVKKIILFNFRLLNSFLQTRFVFEEQIDYAWGKFKKKVGNKISPRMLIIMF